MLVKQHSGPAPHPTTVPNHPPYQPQLSTGVHDSQHAGKTPYSSDHVQLDAPLSSAHIATSELNPTFSDAQGSAWSDDCFMEAYQHYFIPSNIDDFIPCSIDDFIPCSIDDFIPRNIVDYDPSSPEDSDYLDWYLPPAPPTKPIDLPPLQHVDSAEYEYTQYAHTFFPSGVPEEAYSAMHASPPAPLCSHSELAQGLQLAPHNFANYYTPSSTPSGVARVVSAASDTTVYATASNNCSGVATHTQISLRPTHKMSPPRRTNACASSSI